MKATASLHVKLSPDEKREFVEIAESLGMSPSAAVRVFVRKFNACKGFPFDVCQQPSIDFSSTSILHAKMVDGKAVAPSSWREEDDE